MSDAGSRDVERIMRLYWIETPSGRLATAPAPSGSGLDREVKDLLQEKVTNVISLLTDQEVASIGLLAEQSTFNDAGINFSSLPIPDFGILDDYNDAKDLVDHATADLRQGDSVVIHCRGGIGRSSTIAAAVITQLGINPEDAMDRIAEARGLKVPETPAQRMWVHGYAEWAGKQE
ncbi:MAG: tyrosine protein phosphatase [Actinomycetota bacterium]|nr:tyrosine protein phosphatase [Actinomycetota bacterium]